MPLFGPPNIDKLKAKHAVKGLLKVVYSDKDLNRRKAAARALGELRDPEAVMPLARALLQEAAFDLSSASLDALADTYFEVQSANNDLRAVVASALGDIGSPLAIPALIQLRDNPLTPTSFMDGSDQLHRAVVNALAKISPPPARPAQPEPAAESRTTPRQPSVAPARATPAKSAAPTLTKAELAALAPEQQGKLLVDQLWAAETRGPAAKQLAKLGAAAVEPLLAALGPARGSLSRPRDDDDRIDGRRAAARILGQIGDPRAIEPLAAVALGYDDKSLRADAGRALLAIGEPALPAIAEGLKSHEYNAQCSAPDLLGRMGNPKAVAPLAAALPRVLSSARSNIVTALGRTGGEDGARALVEALHYKETQPAAAGWLVKLGAAAVAPLMAALKEPDPEVRSAAAGALRKLADDPTLEPSLRDAASAQLEQIDLTALGAEVRQRQAQHRPTPPSPEPSRRPAPQRPAGLPGPLPAHIFVSSSGLTEGPGPGAAEFQTALAHWNAGQHDLALEHYTRAIEQGLTSVYEASSRLNMGQIYLMRDDVAAAVAQFARALTLSPLTASAAYGCATYLTLIYQELGMTADGLVTVQIAKDALSRIDSIMSAQAANRVRETVRRVYKTT